MNPGRAKSGEDDLKEPKKKKVKPGTILKDPYPIIFWNKLGIPPCNDLWPEYTGVFDGECVLVEDPEDMNEIYTMGYFGKRMLYRKGYEMNVGDIPVVRERQWKRRVEWAAEFGYVLIPPEGESPQGILPDPNPQEYEASNSASQVVKTEKPDKDSQILESDNDDPPSTTSDTAGTSQVCNQISTSGENSDKGETKSKDEDEGKNAECCESSGDVESDKKSSILKSIEGEDMDEGVDDGKKPNKINEGDDISNEADIKYSGTVRNNVQRVCESKGMEGKKENILEDIAQNKADDENDEKEPENKKDEKRKESDIINVDVSENLRGGGEEDKNDVEMDKRNSKSCTNEISKDSMMKDSSEDAVGDDVEKSIDVCKKSDENTSSCEKTESEVDADNLEKGSKKEVDEAKIGKECPNVCSTSDGIESGGSELEEKKEVKEDREDDEKGIKSKQEKDKALSKSNNEEIDAKTDNAVLREGEQEKKPNIKKSLDVKLNENEEQKDSEVVNCETLQSDSAQSKIAVDGKADFIPPMGEDVDKVDITKNREREYSTDNGNAKAKQEDDADGIEECVGVNTAERDAEKAAERDRNGKCDVKKKTNLRDSGISVEILDCDLVKESANVEICCDKLDKRLKSSSLKRSIDESKSPVVEFCEEIGSEGNMETNRSERDYAAKKMKTNEVVILDKKGASNVLSGEYVKNSDKENKLEDGENAQEIQNKTNFGATSSPVDDSMLNESNDCEILEIEDEGTSGNERVSLLKLKLAEENARWLDSDEDIMEVSMEEDEMKENQNRNRAHTRKKKGNVKPPTQTKEAEINSKLQNILSDIQKKLSSDVVIMEIPGKEVTSKGSDDNTLDASKNKEIVDENEDDDVIEIDLQKSDMLELEDCIEDDSVDCEVSNYHENFQRRMKKESSGFKRKEKGVQNADHADDDARSDEVEEIEDKQSLMGHVKLESDCDVSPCIVLPDSDSEDENSEVQVCPRLESDPSVYLPSLDILRLLPEEAFFLAYALGCIQVWDGRNVEIYGEGVEVMIQSDESLGKGDNYDQAQVKSESNNDRNSAEKVAINKEHDKKASSSKKSDLESITKSRKDSLSNDENNSKHISKVRSESLESSSLESTPIKKKNEQELESMDSKSISDKDSPLKSTKNMNDGEVFNSLQTCSKSPKHMSEKPSSSKWKNKRGETDSESFEESLTDNDSVDKTREGDSSLSNCSLVGNLQVEKPLNVKSSLTNVNTSKMKSTNTLSSKKKSFKLNESASNDDPNSNSKSEMNASQVRENGATVDSPITFIDLADSPPSRQWANKGGWSSEDDEDDVIAMDCDNPMVEVQDCKPSANHLFNSTNINRKNCSEDPMSLLDLWNTFRSSRTATSSFSIPFETSYAVYHHFRAKRWVVKPGLRFGGDFLLYKDGPPFYHASYLVMIDSSGYAEKSRLTWNTLAGRNRLAENVAKELMICRVEWPQSITEEELQSPKCLAGLTVQEILVRRWVSIKEREEDEEEEYPSGKDEDFIPLEL